MILGYENLGIADHQSAETLWTKCFMSNSFTDIKLIKIGPASGSHQPLVTGLTTTKYFTLHRKKMCVRDSIMNCFCKPPIDIFKDIRYQHMLETQYILLRVDEIPFVENDEANVKSVSGSWLLTNRSALPAFGLGGKEYPQGSLSANRQAIEAIRNFLGDNWIRSPEMTKLKQRAESFLRLRRDDGPKGGTHLFGSSFDIISHSGNRGIQPKQIRVVHESLRHSAAALSMLCMISQYDVASKDLLESTAAFAIRMEDYTAPTSTLRNEDVLCHSTLACAAKASSDLFPFLNEPLKTRISALRNRCLDILMSQECVEESISGHLRLRVDLSKLPLLQKYEFFIDGYTAALVPEIFNTEKGIRIAKWLISHCEHTKFGLSLPTCRNSAISTDNGTRGDFGCTIALCYALCHATSQDQSHPLHLETNELLRWCLNSYNKPSAYKVPYTESTSKALLMPPPKISDERSLEIENYILEIQKAVALELEGKRILDRDVMRIEPPDGLHHVPKLIAQWQVHKKWPRAKREFKWIPTAQLAANLLGHYTGGLAANYH